MVPLVWLITGASSGLGLQLCIHVLKEGHSAIDTVRNKSKAAKAVDSIEALVWKVVELDTTES
jgi:NAD(P)-dependent dehydrogenase (short-subunit alcohol dehydrogenase family)